MVENSVLKKWIPNELSCSVLGEGVVMDPKVALKSSHLSPMADTVGPHEMF